MTKDEIIRNANLKNEPPSSMMEYKSEQVIGYGIGFIYVLEQNCNNCSFGQNVYIGNKVDRK